MGELWGDNTTNARKKPRRRRETFSTSARSDSPVKKKPHWSMRGHEQNRGVKSRWMHFAKSLLPRHPRNVGDRTFRRPVCFLRLRSGLAKRDTARSRPKAITVAPRVLVGLRPIARVSRAGGDCLDDYQGNAMTANIHVVPAGNEWAVEAAGGGGRTMYFSQEEAIQAATERAKRDKVELLIHGRDGQIRARNSFGHDPRNVRG